MPRQSRRSTDVARSKRAKQANHDAARIAISAAWTAAWLPRTAKYCASITVKAAPHSRLHKVVEAAYTLHAMGQAWQMVAAKMPTLAEADTMRIQSCRDLAEQEKEKYKSLVDMLYEFDSSALLDRPTSRCHERPIGLVEPGCGLILVRERPRTRSIAVGWVR